MVEVMLVLLAGHPQTAYVRHALSCTCVNRLETLKVINQSIVTPFSTTIEAKRFCLRKAYADGLAPLEDCAGEVKAASIPLRSCLDYLSLHLLKLHGIRDRGQVRLHCGRCTCTSNSMHSKCPPRKPLG